ncbi:MAG: hypothetical protein ACYC63_11050 [Armatimonadota bacterium]
MHTKDTPGPAWYEPPDEPDEDPEELAWAKAEWDYEQYRDKQLEE